MFLTPILLLSLQGTTPAPRPKGLRLKEIQVPARARAMAPNLSRGPSGVLLCWLEPGPKKDSVALRFSRRTKEGWSEAETVTSGTRLLSNWADFPSLIEMRSGSILAHWLETGGEDSFTYQIALELQNRNKAFRRIGYLHDSRGKGEHGFVSLVRWKKGVQAFWLDGRDMAKKDGRMLLMTRKVDGEGKLSGELVLDSDVCTCCQTSATLTDRGPLVVYRDHRKGEIRDIALVRWTGKGWSKPALVHRDAWKMPACPVNGPSVDAIGNKVVVAWFTAAGGKASVRVAFSDNGGKSFGKMIPIDEQDPLGRVAVVRLDKGCLLGWLGRRGKRAELRLVQVAEDGKLGNVRRVAQLPANRAVGFPRMLRVDGGALLVWRGMQKKAGIRSLLIQQ
ncbi:MAG TPA: hypothetical protein ENK02_12420 [Planctomycetes bacterium]|nr:hypothetical protein [Planctomycetota bacterium]